MLQIVGDFTHKTNTLLNFYFCSLHLMSLTFVFLAERGLEIRNEMKSTPHKLVSCEKDAHPPQRVPKTGATLAQGATLALSLAKLALSTPRWIMHYSN
jgi:hypothetical protein